MAISNRRLRSIAAHIGASLPAPSVALAAAGSGKVLLSDDEVKSESLSTSATLSLCLQPVCPPF